VNAEHRPLEICSRTNVTLDDLDRFETCKVRALAGREIVEDANVVVLRDQAAHHVRSDETRAPGHKHSLLVGAAMATQGQEMLYPAPAYQWLNSPPFGGWYEYWSEPLSEALSR
jgi:hypothetical protein